MMEISLVGNLGIITLTVEENGSMPIFKMRDEYCNEVSGRMAMSDFENLAEFLGVCSPDEEE